MGTIKKRQATSSRSKISVGILCLLSVGVMIMLVFHRGSPPSVGNDKNVLKEVDALYTAVRVKDQKLVDQCANQLAALKAAGELPDDAATALTEIIASAHGGEWQTAVENLSWFIKGQNVYRHS